MPLLSSNLAMAVHQSPNVHGSREHDDIEFVKVSCVCKRGRGREREKEREKHFALQVWHHMAVSVSPSQDRAGKAHASTTYGRPHKVPSQVDHVSSLS